MTWFCIRKVSYTIMMTSDELPQDMIRMIHYDSRYIFVQIIQPYLPLGPRRHRCSPPSSLRGGHRREGKAWGVSVDRQARATSYSSPHVLRALTQVQVVVLTPSQSPATTVLSLHCCRVLTCEWLVLCFLDSRAFLGFFLSWGKFLLVYLWENIASVESIVIIL